MCTSNLYNIVQLPHFGEKGGEGEIDGESNRQTYTTMHRIDSQWGFAICLRELKQGVCINLEGRMGREMGGRFKRAGIYVNL